MFSNHFRHSGQSGRNRPTVWTVGEANPMAIWFFCRTVAVRTNIKEVARYSDNFFLEAFMEEVIGVR